MRMSGIQIRFNFLAKKKASYMLACKHVRGDLIKVLLPRNKLLG